MINSHNQSPHENQFSDSESGPNETNETYCTLKTLAVAPQLHLHQQVIAHHPRAGINPVADAASRLFTTMNELKSLKSYQALDKLQSELIREINTFHDGIKSHGYNAAYTLVCRYVLCAAIDEQINSTSWGSHKHWEPYSLLGTYSQDTRHQENFFSMLERAIKEPDYYIDLMELMYLCLSMGYRGRYRSQDYNQSELEQITNTLYKHIRSYRGNFSKSLSPNPRKSEKPLTRTILHKPESLWTTLLATGCIIMIIFIGLSYLTEMISNEAISNISNLQASPNVT